MGDEGREKRLLDIAIAMLGIIRESRSRLVGEDMSALYLDDVERRAREAINAYALHSETPT